MKGLKMNERSYILRIVNDHRTGKRLYDIISVRGLDMKAIIYPYGPLWYSKVKITEKTDDRNRMKIWLDLMGFKIKRYNIYEDIFGKMRGYFELEKC